MGLTKDEIIKLLQAQKEDFTLQIDLKYPEEEKDDRDGEGSNTTA